MYVVPIAMQSRLGDDQVFVEQTDTTCGEEREMSDEKMKNKWKRSETRKSTSLGVAKTQPLKEVEQYIER